MLAMWKAIIQDTTRVQCRKINERMNVQSTYHTPPFCRAQLLKHQPNREDLPKRSMKDSYTTAVLPFKEDERIRVHYVNHLGRLRLGRLMEDLDLFAVWICHRHVYVPKLPKGIPMPYTFVTLLVDKVEILQDSLSAFEDIELSGHVSWAGNSSMEITIYLRQEMQNMARAVFMMVSRNATNTGPAPVNPLEPANELEERCLADAQRRQTVRKANQHQSVLNKRPTKSDEQLMFELFQRTKGKSLVHDIGQTLALPANSAYMSKSYQSTMLHPFPDNRNAHNTIFGGYIMRNAVEISIITASIYSSGRPQLQCILDVAFYNPVPVDSFIKITAYVVYTSGIYMQLMTIVQALNANTLEKLTSNAFYLTFAGELAVKELLPSSYQETLWYLNGKKKMEVFQQLKQNQEKHSKQCKQKA
ncbi:acyl-coenzyme A thioesterase 9, mitochondrial isoform X2 [Drosophila busckii]|uniref:acyl-coenzyme A thioesterase 9, mitochondrial isoform X2 n=1 Tax=Drosophila busckii TaxID=30019 RepID=UPI00083F025A|nr:acyl-coenzyme A thioesterase 9, mitochondrial isoform X2 [Drosophila busckii]